MLMDKAQLNESQAVSYFLAGLRHEMEMMVRMFNPGTLQDAYSLAKLQEALRKDPVNQGQRRGKWGYNKNQVCSNSFPVTKSNLFVSNSGNMGLNKANTIPVIAKKPLNLTPKQMEEK